MTSFDDSPIVWDGSQTYLLLTKIEGWTELLRAR